MANEIVKRKTFEIGDGQTELFDPQETSWGKVAKSLYDLIDGFERVAAMLPVSVDEKTEARKRAKEDVRKKRKALYK